MTAIAEENTASKAVLDVSKNLARETKKARDSWRSLVAAAAAGERIPFDLVSQCWAQTGWKGDAEHTWRTDVSESRMHAHGLRVAAAGSLEKFVAEHGDRASLTSRQTQLQDDLRELKALLRKFDSLELGNLAVYKSEAIERTNERLFPRS